MRLLRRLALYARVLVRGRRNRVDLMRYLVRRPAILTAVSMYETATVLSNRVDGRLKALAGLKTSALAGCPF